VSAADELHKQVFGFTPSKAGTAFERLAAVVLAGLGWENVKHETKLQPQGRRAGQRLDITATHPDGAIERLLAECKDWNRDVGKGTMDALVGVRDQANFDAAMAVTTKGFTRGAIDVAVDENIAMVVLREVRPDESFVMSVEIQTVIWGSDWGNVQVLTDSNANVSDGQPGDMSTEDRFLYIDGTPAESLREIFESRSTGRQEGVFDHEIRFEDGRLAPMATGHPIPIVGIKWTETVSKSSPHKSVTKTEGEPCLVVEQLEEDGTPVRPRLVVDRHLNAWDITGDGAVVEKGSLL
jgi:Restriction endonuclease